MIFMLTPFCRFGLCLLHSQSFNHKPRHCPTGILLLSRNQVAVAHGMRFETTRYDEICSRNLPRFVFDPEWLNALAYEFICVRLLRIGKAGPCFPVYQKLAVDFCLKKNAGCVAEDGCDFSRLIGLRCQSVDTVIVVVRVHWRLSANKEDGVVIRQVELVDRFRILDELRMFAGGEESERYQVVCGILAYIPGITPVIRFEF